jgi:hypothetical protein
MLALLNLGGAELLLILAMLFFLALGAAAVVALVYFLARASRTKSGPVVPPQTAPPLSPLPPQDLEQQLRTLAKLKEDGVITQDDFDTKKRKLLGL